MDSDSIHLLETLLPHIQTALRLRTKVMNCKASNLFSETALDAMSIAAFLVTAKGRVRHTNQLAATLPSAWKRPRHSPSASFMATDANENTQLESLISAATSSRQRNSPEATPGGAIRISRSDSQEPLQVTVIPVPQENHIVDGASSALVFVSDPSLLPRPRHHAYAATLWLYPRRSPSRRPVAEWPRRSRSCRQPQHHLSRRCVRFHLKRVLSKTGTRRQAELMRLMLSLPAHPARS